MIFTYTIKKDEFENIEGFITLDIPSRKERLEIFKEVNLGTDNNELTVAKKDNVQLAMKLDEIAKKYVKEVYIHNKNKTFIINNFDELEYYDFYQVLINKLVSFIFNGVPLGNE